MKTRKGKIFLWEAEEPLSYERRPARIVSDTLELIVDYLSRKYGDPVVLSSSDEVIRVTDESIKEEDKQIGIIRTIEVLEKPADVVHLTEKDFTPQEVKVELDVFGIVLTGTESDIESECVYDGHITSDLKETCWHCNDPDCMMECPDYNEYCSDRDMDCQLEKEKEGRQFRVRRLAAEMLEDFVLISWSQGIDVTTSEFKKVVETLYYAHMANNNIDRYYGEEVG